MTTSPRDGSESTAKQEFSASNGINPKPSSSSWLRLKDPRIVRVSRAFGGKDRHSKVQTIKGLRDRRVRLSVSTAIQLYDLQDRLGLNQPSKVFDWLLHAAKDEIDELPPLQTQPEHFIHNYQGLRIGANTNSEDPILGVTTSNIGNFDTLLVANRPKEVAREVGSNAKGNWIKRIDDEEQNKVDQGDGAQDSSSFSYPRRVDYFPLPGSLNYNAVQCDAYHHWEASNLSLSHLGSQGLTSQMGDQHTFNIVSLAPAPTTSVEFNNPRQFLGQFQMLTSNLAAQNSGAPHLYSNQSTVRPPFHLSMNPKLPN